MVVRKIKAKLVLKLRAEGLTGRQIAAQGMSRTSVAAVIEAADREGISWGDVAGLDDAAVYARLFPGRGEHESVHAQPDWPLVHRELARVGGDAEAAARRVCRYLPGRGFDGDGV